MNVVSVAVGLNPERQPQNLITSKPQNLITSKPNNLKTSKPNIIS